MIVPMMCVRKMMMRMRDRFVPMSMRVPGAGRNRNIMRVLMMFVVNVRMLVIQQLMTVFVQVSFAQMQPYAVCHQAARDQQLRRECIAKKHRE